MSETIYSWSFDSKKQRGSMWYTIAISVVIGLVIWGFLMKQYGLSFVLILISGLFYFVEVNSDDIVNVEITKLGISIENHFYDFSGIDSFSIFYEGRNVVLIRFFLSKRGIKTLDLDIDNKIASDLKEIFSGIIKENEKTELSTSDKLIKLLRL